MSNSKIMSAVSTAFQFASDKVNENLMEFIRRENLDITEEQKRKMSSVVRGSVEQSLSLTADSIQKSI